MNFVQYLLANTKQLTLGTGELTMYQGLTATLYTLEVKRVSKKYDLTITILTAQD